MAEVEGSRKQEWPASAFYLLPSVFNLASAASPPLSNSSTSTPPGDTRTPCPLTHGVGSSRRTSCPPTHPGPPLHELDHQLEISPSSSAQP